MLAIFMIYHRVKLLTLIPAILNALVYCTAFFSDIAFSYSETNNFLRGPLGYTFIAVGLLYVLGLCVALFKSFESRHGHEWLLILYFMSAAILTVILTIFFQVDGLFALGHGVHLVRKGVSGKTQNQRFEFNMSINNPALTAQVLVNVARASLRQQPGCYTMVEIPVIDMLPGERADLIEHLV